MNSQPPPKADRLFAPNVYVFAYSLVDGAEHKSNSHSNPLWEYGDKILGHFTDKKITDNLDYPNAAKNKPNRDRTYLISDDALYFTSDTSDDTSDKYPGIEGFAQAQKIKDSYALWLNVGYSDEDETAEPVSVESLQQFNPSQVLSLPLTPNPSPTNGEGSQEKAEKFIGQTLLITAWLTTKTQQRDSDYLRNLADQCCENLLKENAPPFYRAGELFDSAIFEYGKPSQGAESPQVLVWLFRDEKADRQYNEYQQELVALFLYRRKIVKTFQDSRLVYQHLEKAYRHLEDNLDRLQTEFLNNPLDVMANDDYLEKFKTQLKTFATESLPYTRFLRKMEAFHNTIEINLYNYCQIIEEICAKIGDDKEELSFLREFGKETAPRFCRQIKADLGYFQHGTDLIDTAIASIRGILEIDQAKRDRTWQRWEKKREKRQEEQLKQAEEKAKAQEQRQKEADQDLQDHIQAIGVGIAAGAIVASTSGLITQPWYLPNGEKIEVPLIPHPFFIGSIASVLCSVGAWWIAHCLIKRGRSHQKD